MTTRSHEKIVIVRISETFGQKYFEMSLQFDFRLSVQFHQYPHTLSSLKLPISEGQMGKWANPGVCQQIGKCQERKLLSYVF